MKIILIGRCCRIILDMIDIGLKDKSLLFDWTWTDTLSEINTIIQKLINNIKIETKRIDGNDYLVDTNIKTGHYINKDYNEIVKRRSERFMNYIRKNDEILFIRDDLLTTIKTEEICEFYSLVKKINPVLNFKLLLLSNEDSFKEIIYENLTHKIYNKSLYKQYINECFYIEKVTNIDLHDLSDGENNL
jgi:hypothetical protein